MCEGRWSAALVGSADVTEALRQVFAKVLADQFLVDLSSLARRVDVAGQFVGLNETVVGYFVVGVHGNGLQHSFAFGNAILTLEGAPGISCAGST